MNKFLWRLFEIEDEEEFVDLSRRGFLRGVGATAVLVAAGPKIFLPPSGGWKPAVAEPVYQFGFIGFKDLSEITCNNIVPMLSDGIFKVSPVLTKLLVKAPQGLRG